MARLGPTQLSSNPLSKASMYARQGVKNDDMTGHATKPKHCAVGLLSLTPLGSGMETHTTAIVRLEA